MPIRLWSIVVSHPTNPFVVRGRFSSGGSRGAWGASGRSVVTGSSVVVIGTLRLVSGGGRGQGGRSLQRVQEGDELGDLVLAEVEVGHVRAGLLGGRIAQPPAKVVVVHLQYRPREHAALTQVGEVRTEGACTVTLNRVATGAALLPEESGSCGGVGAGLRIRGHERGAPGGVGRHPPLEVGSGMGDDPEAHVGVGQPA